MKKSINICFILAMLVLLGFLFTACSTEEDTPVVPNPVFSLESCTFKGSTNVGITCSELGATIRYTTDGSTPTGAYGTIYTQPIEVNNTMLIKARAVKPSWEPSEVISVLYTVTGSVVNPTFSVSGGTYNTNLIVGISCATPGATIRYTTDGTDPTPTYGTVISSSNVMFPSQGAYYATKTTTLKAIAYRSDWTNSSVVSAEYTLQVLPPTISPAAGTYNPSATLTLTPATSGSSCFLSVDGGANWLTAPRTITSSSTVLVKATKAGWQDSVSTNSYTYTILGSTAVPTFSVAGGLYTHATNVQISCATSGVTIQWTTNAGATWHTGTSVHVGASCTLQAKASKTGMTTATATAIYTITGTVATPTFNVAAGTYTHVTNVQISCATPGATIQWTTNNGVNWNTGNTALISGSCTLQAKATKLNWLNSGVASASYTITGKVATPIFSVAGGLYTHVTNVQISSSTPGVSMQWSTNSGVTWNSGTTATITHDCTLQAKATKSMWIDSDIGSVVYQITGQVATPTYSVAAGTYTHATNVQISCITPGATIQWTTNDGASWYSSNPVLVSKSCTLKAKATKTDWADSAQQTASYEITGTVATPTLSVPAGTYTHATNVQISCATPGATIQWSTDGGSSWNTGSSVLVDKNMTLQVMATKTGWLDSGTSYALYILTIATPTLSVPAGTYTHATNVQISCTTPGATIQWSIDGGSNWNTGSSVSVDKNMTLQAKAVITGWNDSATVSASYSFKVATPTFSLASGTYFSATNVQINCVTPGVTIQWSTNSGSSWGSGNSVPFAVSGSLIAKADKSGWQSSDTTTAVNYTIVVAKPTFSVPSGTYSTVKSIQIGCASPNVDIYFSIDGGTNWNSGATVSLEHNMKLLAKAQDKSIASKFAISTNEYMFKLLPPTGMTSGKYVIKNTGYNAYKKVCLYTSHSGALIEWSTNGGATWNSGTSGLEIVLERSRQVHARTVKANCVTSDTVIGDYQLQLTPFYGLGDGYGWDEYWGSVNWLGDAYWGGVNVSISSIYQYSTDGGVTWQVGANLTFTTSKRVMIKAVREGCLDSVIVTNQYDILTYHWTKTIGGGTEKEANDFCVDSSGNVYITGKFTGTVDFDPSGGVDSKSSVSGSSDAFITKLNSDGSYGWTKIIGGQYSDSGYSICVDTDGSVYVIGSFYGTVDLDPGVGVDNRTSNGQYESDGFILKLNSAGDRIWAKTMDAIVRLSACVNGNVYVAGSFSGTKDFDPSSGVDYKGSKGSADVFLTKLGSDGSYGWTKVVGGSDTESIKRLTVDNSENIYLVGCFRGEADFQPGIGVDNITSYGSDDVYVLKFFSDGSRAWVKRIGGSSTDVGNGVAVDNGGSVYLTGHFYGTADFDPGSGVDAKSSLGSSDIFLTKLNSDGGFGWNNALRWSDGLDEANDVCVDNNGNVYITGKRFNYENSQREFFIAKLTSDGTRLWRKIKTTNDKFIAGTRIYADSSGTVYVLGYFSSTEDFCLGYKGTADINDSKSATGDKDIFIMKFSQQ